MAGTTTSPRVTHRAMTAGGLSVRRLARLHDAMARYVERGEIPGIVTALSRRGEVYVDAIGTMAQDDPSPIRRDTIFRIASMTKPITAAATMVLVEECRLRLDDPVDRWLPELADRRVLRRLDAPLDDTVPAERPITTRDLLTFTMGFGLVFADPNTHPIVKAVAESEVGGGPPGGQMPGPDEWIRRFGQLPLMYQPGQCWQYNTGADVLGVLISRVAGKPFETFLRERILEPLGMKDTGFSVPEDKLDRLATSYATDFGTGALRVYDLPRGGEWSHPPSFPSGAGGLVSTVDDVLAFGQMMLNRGTHGGERILSRPAVETMTTDQLTPEQKPAEGPWRQYWQAHGWGFGMAVVTRRDDLSGSVGRFGWDGGLGTSWHSDPREELVGILMTQVAWTSPMPPPVCRDFWTSVYAALDD